MTMNTNQLDIIRVWLDRVQKPLQFLIADPEFGSFISSGNIRMYLLIEKFNFCIKKIKKTELPQSLNDILCRYITPKLF